jgi:hypothetical protein
MSKSNVCKWHKRFRERREDVNDDEKQGTPVMKQTEKKSRKSGNLCNLTTS